MPKDARPIFGRPKRMPLAVEHPLRKPLNQHVLNAVRNEPEDSTVYVIDGSNTRDASSIADRSRWWRCRSFQKQLLMWSKLDNQQSHTRAPSDADTQSQSSTSSTSHSSRFTVRPSCLILCVC